MNGEWSTIQSLYADLGVPFLLDTSGASQSLSHVAAKTNEHTVTLTARNIPESGVPDVRGMSLRDALQLLERKGMSVDISGRGTVRRQSIAPGTAHRNGQTILLELS